jgi:hypothetical protein
MTGAPSETWHKFRFARGEPPFAGVFDPFGGMLWVAMRDHASGRLPLTRRSSRSVAFATWIPWGLIAGAFVLWTAATIFGVSADSDNLLESTAWYVLFAVGVLGLICGLAGFVVKALICPRGRLMNGRRGEPDFVEIRNVHHAFVDAATQMYAEREDLPLPP